MLWLEIALILLLLAGLSYFLFDATAVFAFAVFAFTAQWAAIIAILIFFGFFVAIGIHYTDMMFRW